MLHTQTIANGVSGPRPEPTLPCPPRLPSPSPMLNDHGRSFRQLLALAGRLERRGPGLTLSSERGHGTDFGMERWWNKVATATQTRRDKPAAGNHSCKVQISQQRESREGGVGRTRDLKAGPLSTPHSLSGGSRRGNPDQTTSYRSGVLYWDPGENHIGRRGRDLESLFWLGASGIYTSSDRSQ